MNKRSIAAELSLTASQRIKESNYWLEKLSGELGKTGFPYDRQPADCRESIRAEKDLGIDPEIIKKLMKIASGSDTRLHILLVTAVVILLHSYNNDTRDIIIAVPVYRQERKGKFINTVLTLRNQLVQGMSFKELLFSVRQNLGEAVEHQNYPIETLLYNLDVPALFDVAVLLENIHEKSYLDKVDVNMIFSFNRNEAEVSGTVEYNAGLYEAATIEHIITHFNRLLHEALFNVDIPAAEIHILSDEEKQQLLYEFNESDLEYEEQKTIAQLFADQVEKTPDNIALVGVGVGAKHSGPAQKENASPLHEQTICLTYRELNRAANQLARCLRKKGAAPGKITGLLLDRTVDMGVAILAVIKSGSAYLPITPDTPVNRVFYLLEDSGASILLSRGAIFNQAEAAPVLHILDLDEPLPALQQEAAGDPQHLNNPTDPVYCIFTSGSTGVPKGVLVCHRNLNNLVSGLDERIYKKYNKSLQIALLSPYIFDASIKMIFAALLLGHTLHIVPEETRVDGYMLLDYFENFKIEVCDGTPTHLKMLKESGIGDRKNLCLKQFLIGGETLNEATLAAFYQQFEKLPPLVTNVYGPTECCVDAAVLDIPAADFPGIGKITIGKPMPNHRIYILDTGANNRLQPAGVPGELCIAGHGVSAGYLNRPELTAEKFVTAQAASFKPQASTSCKQQAQAKDFFFTHQLSTHQLIYRSGDLARWLPNGNIEFLGRIDQQVKIRGYRLEPGEIENRILKHERIKEAIVAAKKDPGGFDYLCAYIVVKNTPGTESVGARRTVPLDLRQYLSQTLPDYMIPPYFVQLQQLPLTPTGKIDRKALPEPDIGVSGSAYAPPQNPCQEKLTAMWCDILRIDKEKIGIDSDFFSIGGHSLKATIMIARIHQAFDVKIPLAKIFEKPTIRGLAEEISKSGKTEFVDLGEVEKKEYYPLSFNQERLWYINRSQPASSAYTTTNGIVLDHEVAEADIREVLNRLMQHHENFRTGFKIAAGKPVQFILPRIAPAFYTIDLSSFAEQEKQEERERILNELTGTTFDLSRPPLFRSTLLKFAPDHYEFISCMHHIVSDGWSMEIVTDEFRRLYRAVREGEEAHLEAIRFRYRDFACWQNKQLTQAAGKRAYQFWKSRLEKGVPAVKIPGDFHINREGKPGSAWRFAIGRELKEKVKTLADTTNTTLFTVLFSAYLLMISRFADREEVVCTIINSGRDHAALHRITGFFVNSILFHNRVEAAESFRDFLQRINVDTMAVFNNQNFPLEPVFGKLQMAYPTIPASFNLLNMQDRTAREELAPGEPRRLDNYQDVKYDIESYLFEYKNCIEMTWTYNRDVYKPETLKGIIEEYIKILEYFTNRADGSFEDYLHLHGRIDQPAGGETKDMAVKPGGAQAQVSELYKSSLIQELEASTCKTGEPGKYTDIQAVESRSYYPLSSAQKRLFVLEQQGGINMAYNMPAAVRITGLLDLDTLIRAFKTLMVRHEGFRTSFLWKKGEPVQRVHDTKTLDFKIDYYAEGIIENQQINSLNGLSPKAFAGGPGGRFSRKEPPWPPEAKELVSQFLRPFDLSCAPLLRVGLIHVLKDEHILVIDMHHIIADGASMDILFREFIALYSGRRLPVLRVRYIDFIQWEKEFINSPLLRQQEEFWLEQLSGELPELRMPLDFKRPEKQSFAGDRLSFMIPTPVAQKLEIMAREKNVTLNILFLSIYYLVLHLYSGQDDIIVASVVSGRNHADTENIIGMFANSLPLRNRILPHMTFPEFLESVRKRTLAAYENQDYPFERMVELLNLSIDPARNPIFDTMLAFHNEADTLAGSQREIAGLRLAQYPLDRQEAKFDFKLDVLTGGGGGLACSFEYNTHLFKEETIRGFERSFLRLIDEVLVRPGQKIADMEIFSREEKLAITEKRRRNNPVKERPLNLVVSATFTAEPLEDYILWWSEQFGWPIKPVFAPYNQVFHQLLDEESLLSANKGINLLLVRFEDWIRDLQLPAEEVCDKLEEDFERLSKIFREKRKHAPCFVGMFPAADLMSCGPEAGNYIKGLNRRWRKIVKETENAYPVDYTTLKELYAVGEIFDHLADREGHIPFSSEFYAAMAAVTVRQVYALDRNPFKVIVLDCDNTLWQGICGEDGAAGVQISPPYLELQRFFIGKHEEGFLLALCSKNNEADVWEVFEKNPAVLLQKEHLVGWRINWQPKSGNLRTLAEELNLGIGSFIFLDDSPVECAEVTGNCPEVLTLQLPRNPESIPLFLRHVWAFDKIKVTAEDRSRTRMYRAEKERKAAENGSLTLKDFLAGLQLKISMNFMNPDQVERVSQLTQRTNQFNLSTIRRRRDEIEKMAAEPGARVWVIEVSDRFGAYGLVGVVISKEQEGCLFIDTFLLSCRVLGREVEAAILAGLRRYCRERQLKNLTARYYPTPKNKPVLDFLQDKWILREDRQDAGYSTFIYPLEGTGEAIEFAGFYYLQRFEQEQSRETPAAAEVLLDHIALAVTDMGGSADYFRSLGYSTGEKLFDPLQRSHLVMCEKPGSSPVELVAAVDRDSPTNRVTAENGDIPYHLCYRVKNAAAFLESLKAGDIEFDVVSELKPALLFKQKKVMFIHVRHVGLIELLEDEGGEFKIENTGSTVTDWFRILVNRPKFSVKFFKQLGYVPVTQPGEEKGVNIILTKNGTADIELIVPGAEDHEEQTFLHRNGPHLYRLCFDQGTKEEKSGRKSGVEHPCIYVMKRREQPAPAPRHWEIDTGGTDEMLHKKYLLPLQYYKAELLPGLTTSESTGKTGAPKKYEAPQNETESTLAGLWKKVLRLQQVGVNDSFFACGGNSLNAITLLSEIHKAFNVELTLKDIFDNRTIRELSRLTAGAEERVFSAIAVVEKKDSYPLSSAQRRLYFLQQMEPRSTGYNLPLFVPLEGDIDSAKLLECFRKLIHRHEGLRTTFEIMNGRAVQVIHDDVEFEIEHCEAGDFVRPFDLSKAPLLRVGLSGTGAQERLLLVDIHHIITDGTSNVILLTEYMALYKGEELPPLRIQYKEYACWQNQLFAAGHMARQEAYWLEQFSGEVPVLSLPGDYPRPRVRSFAGKSLTFELEAEETAALNKIALDQGVTLYMVLLVVFNVLLARLSGQEDIVVGTPTAGRRHADLAGIIGIFINTLGMRNFPAGQKTFAAFLQEVKGTTLTAFENQEYQFEDLVEKVEIKRDVSRNPLFDVLFVLQNMDSPEIEIPGLKSGTHDYEAAAAKFDLSLYGMESGEKLTFMLEYSTTLFKEETIKRYVNYFENLVNGLIYDPQEKISDIPMVPADEMRQILFDFNDTAVPYPVDKRIHELFENQVEKTPHRIAMVGAKHSEPGENENASPLHEQTICLTYRELNRQADILERLLISKGVHSGTLVGLMLLRSTAMITGVVGILKAGGAYLPIDPGYPQERIAYMLRESRTAVLLTTRSFEKEVEKLRSLEVEKVFIEDCRGEPCVRPSGKTIVGARRAVPSEPAACSLQPVTNPLNLAYVIYTSGSTGRPKGVAISHRDVVNFITGMSEKIDFSPGKTILAVTTICFDIFVLEILLPLTRGLKFIIAGEIEQKVPGELARLIVKHSIDMVQFTPSRLNLLLSVDENLECLRGVSDLMVGGEAFPERLFLVLQEKFKGSIYNMYGPTEATVYSAGKDLTAAKGINIGSPIANTQIYIVDKAGFLQPPGLPGELCIGGDGLARGYLNRPELTAERFVTAQAASFKPQASTSFKPKAQAKDVFLTHQLSTHQLIYRTGDLACWLPEGEIEFLGRMDYQVKIRGFRIELGEIENALKSYQNKKIIKDAVVVDREDNDGVKRLAAYIVTGEEVKVSDLRSYLAGKLPDYMIPSYFVQIEKLPLTPNGKIDKKALDKSGTKLAGGTTYQEPRNALEEKIAAAWRETLHLDKVGIHDNYFELGGTSFDIITVNLKLQESFQREIPVVAMFRYTTVHALAGYLKNEETALRDRGDEVKRGKQNIKALRSRTGVKHG